MEKDRWQSGGCDKGISIIIIIIIIITLLNSELLDFDLWTVAVFQNICQKFALHL